MSSVISSWCAVALAVVWCMQVHVNSKQFQFINYLGKEVWIGCRGNQGYKSFGDGGWILGVGKRISVRSPDEWAGRFWARTGCNATTGRCETGHCADKVQCQENGGEPPTTLAEFTLGGYDGNDYYDISLVDGFNVKISITPIGGAMGNKNICNPTKCVEDINAECPVELRQVNADGTVVGCKSSCNALNTDEYCCRGEFGTPQTCKPANWTINSAKLFKEKCPEAYSYAYDDYIGTYICKAPAYLVGIGR